MGIARVKKGLWFTIGTHATWNLVIVVITLFTLLGGPVDLHSPNRDFSVSYPSTWQQSEEARKVFGPRPDVALGSPRGSFVAFGHHRASGDSAQQTLALSLSKYFKEPYQDVLDDLEVSAVNPRLRAGAYEITYRMDDDAEQPAFSTFLVVQRPGADKALFAEMRCLNSACFDDDEDFRKMLMSLRLPRR